MTESTTASDAVEIRLGLPDGCREDAARLFYEAFSRQLRAIMPDEENAVRLLPGDLDPSRVIVAMAEGRMVGFAGLAYGGRNYMTFRARDFRERFGLIGGPLRYLLYISLTRPTLRRDLVVDGLGVAGSMRRRGIGAMLVDAVCEFAKANGFHAVRLEVAEGNEDARRLYERCGFTTVRVRRVPGFLEAQADFQADIEMCKQIT